jgi:transposase
MTIEKTQARRRYTAEMKAQVVAQCEGAGASVAKWRWLAHGINANFVHRWRRLAGKVKLLAFI